MRSFVNRAQVKLAQLREERGATDPILVIASIAITLALLLGGTFMITQVISNAKNLNAKSDLDKISVVEASLYASSDNFAPYDSVTDHRGILEKPTADSGGIGFSPTSGGKVNVILSPSPSLPAGGANWAAVSKSTGNGFPIYIKSSESSKIATAIGGKLTATEMTDLSIDSAAVDALVAAANTGKTP